MPSAEVQVKKWPARERMWFRLVLIAFVVLYIPTFRFLFQKWMEDAQYSLAFLVPFVSGYFTYKRWPEIKQLEPTPTVWGLVLILFALLLHLAGVILDISGPSGVSVLMCLLGCCLYFHGAALVKMLAFPLAYTVFMIPVPNGVLDLVGFPLQLWASGSTARLLTLMGMEVTRTGVNLSVSGFEFQVAQACSGMSSLVALIGVTAVFAYITRLPATYKWILFLLALPIALAANVARITAIALVGYEFGEDAAMSIFHDWSSPILFVVAILLLIGINRVMEWHTDRRTTS